MRQGIAVPGASHRRRTRRLSLAPWFLSNQSRLWRIVPPDAAARHHHLPTGSFRLFVHANDRGRVGRLCGSPEQLSRSARLSVSLVTVCQLPAPNATNVHMHEIRLGVVSDAAAVQRQSGIADRGSLRTRKAYIDGLGLRVEALLCDARGVRAKILVAPRRPVSADHLNLGTRT